MPLFSLILSVLLYTCAVSFKLYLLFLDWQSCAYRQLHGCVQRDWHPGECRRCHAPPPHARGSSLVSPAPLLKLSFNVPLVTGCGMARHLVQLYFNICPLPDQQLGLCHRGPARCRQHVASRPQRGLGAAGEGCRLSQVDGAIIFSRYLQLSFPLPGPLWLHCSLPSWMRCLDDFSPLVILCQSA